jgi:hypothetical protein
MRSSASMTQPIVLSAAVLLACGAGEGTKPDTPSSDGVGGSTVVTPGGGGTTASGGRQWSPQSGTGATSASGGMVGSGGSGSTGECVDGAPCSTGDTCTTDDGQTCQCRRGIYRC